MLPLFDSSLHTARKCLVDGEFQHKPPLCEAPFPRGTGARVPGPTVAYCPGTPLTARATAESLRSFVPLLTAFHPARKMAVGASSQATIPRPRTLLVRIANPSKLKA